MAKPRRDRTRTYDHHLLLVDPDDSHRELVTPHLAQSGFRVVAAADGEAALALAAPELTAAAVDLVLPRVDGLDVIRALRARLPDLALLAFSSVAPASEAVAAVMAGADAFLEWRDDTDAADLARALARAIERRALTRVIDRREAEIAAARSELARLAGALEGAAASAPYGPEDVLPFEDAARRYLAGAARLFDGDAKGLAGRLGVSYFALRRLLARYRVPFPGRAHRGRARAHR
jgi:CheY-like chemotaxis protein